MKFTIKQIDRCAAELQKLQNSKKHWPVKVNYAIAKNLKALLAELQVYNAERTRVLKENALKDSNGNAVVEDGSYKFAEDKEQEVIKEIDDMYYYYLNPLYTLKENMTEEDFEQLFKLIRQANKILAK